MRGVEEEGRKAGKREGSEAGKVDGREGRRKKPVGSYMQGFLLTLAKFDCYRAVKVIASILFMFLEIITVFGCHLW